jgi:PAS domain S-box-containing protein
LRDPIAGDDQAGKRTLIRMILTGIVIVAIAVSGVFAVFQFIDTERARELNRWQQRLGVVADSRLADIEGWLGRQTGALDALAENGSLQLYLSILTEAGGSAADAAEATYLGSLLTVAAKREGFEPPATASAVRANVERAGTAGMALLALDGRIIVASASIPAIEGKLAAFVAGAAKGKPAVSRIFSGPTGAPSIAFLAPVFDIQGDRDAESQIGTVLGVKLIARELYPLLKQPGSTEDTTEALMVRIDGASVRYLSPLGDGTAPLKRRLALDTPELAAAFAIRNPGGFGRKRDYRDVEVLVTARTVTDVAWTLLYKVDVAEALAESESRLQQLLIAFFLIIGLVLIGMAALWYYGTSRRANEAADRFEKLAERFQGQRDFMHLVTDSQPNTIIIYDAKGHYRWFNRVAIERSGLDRESLWNKPVASVIGPVEGKRITGWIDTCLSEFKPASYTHTIEVEGIGERIYNADLIPLPATHNQPAGVLVVSQDITDSVRERTKRERIMRQLVNTLVGMVDRRDPYSANHSMRVGMVARAMSQEMDLDPGLGEVSEIAGNLMNLGKMAVPESVLTKSGALDKAEIQLIRDSVLASADLVADIEFDGPVALTIRQLQENFNGSGMPKGLKGDEILLTARIVAVANAFVAMVSARAYRPGMAFDRAIDILLKESGENFDRRAVTALVNHLENRGGRAQWASFDDPIAKET